MKVRIFLAASLVLLLASFCSAAPVLQKKRAGFLPPELIKLGSVPYPERSLKIGEEGITWLKILVESAGTAGKVDVLKSSGSPDLDAYATQVALKSRYRPGRRNGKAYAGWLVLPITSELPERVKGDRKQIDAFLSKVSTGPRKASSYESLGALYLQEHAWSEAEKAYLEATKLSPSKADNWVYLGNAEVEMEEYVPAQMHYEKALSLSPSSSAAAAGLAKAYASTGNQSKALYYYQKAAALNPNDASVQTMTGLLLMNANEPDKAIPFLEKAHAADPKNATVVEDLAYAYYQQKDYQKSATTYQEAVKLEPNKPILYNNWGSALMNANMTQEAIPVLEKASQLDPSNAGIFYSLGIAYFEQKEYVSAIPVLQKAAGLLASKKTSSGILADTYLELGLAELQTGDNAAAVETLEKASAMKPKDTVPMMALAQAYEVLKANDKAISMYEKIVQLDPQNAMSHEQLGYLYYQKGSADKAKKELQQALSLYKAQNQTDRAKHVQDNLKKL